MVNGERLDSPAFKVTRRDLIKVSGTIIKPPEPTRMWMYHKPAGLITSTRDPEGRASIFDHLPKSLPRVVTVGRLDLTTEGLLLLTNDGELARKLELPSTGLERHYRARAHGRVTEEGLKDLATGVIVDGVEYAPIEATHERSTGTNNWLHVVLKEGKNREVRKALGHIGLTVNRLIRTKYGPFELANLASGALEEIPPERLVNILGEENKTERMEPPRRTGPSDRRPGGRKPGGFRKRKK
ncbi:MAG: pseudouridine synthase [Ponticaulis sp.]|nr:pseudouridine synthase [Ponticaulis sp.]